VMITGTSAYGPSAPGAAVAHAFFTYWRFS